jgi:DNA-binding MarR family transcriptional regulator
MARKVPQDMDRLIEVDLKEVLPSTFMLFVQTAQAVLKYTDAYLYRKTRLSISKLIVLKALAINRQGMMPSKIAEWTSTERNNITALVDRMSQEGLVTSERNSSNKRLVSIKLTDKGREVLNRAMPVAEEVVKQVMSSITEGDAALLREKLRILRQNAHYGLEYVARPSEPQPD